MRNVFYNGGIPFSQIPASSLQQLIKIALITMFFLFRPLFSVDKSCQKSIAKIQSNYNYSFGHFNVNRITTDFSNNGVFVSQVYSSGAGMRFDNISINYTSGLWIADSSNGKIRLSVTEYSSEYAPGPFGVEYDSLKHNIISLNQTTGSILPILGDQMHWYVYNDGIHENHTVYSAEPLDIEIHATLWGYKDNYKNINLQNIMFVKSLVINKGDSNIENGYIGFWSDPDLGWAGDDFVGCDSTLNLGYCYNDGPDDYFGENPPAHGITLLQGPIVESNNNTAKAFGNYINGYQNLPMTSFVKYT
ncbi:hypothetical protein ACFL5D_04425 [Candidatus Neomarinimicrobiota bacterium]